MNKVLLEFEQSGLNIESIRSIANEATIAGSDVIKKHFGAFASDEIASSKAQDISYNLVTVADVESEKAIASVIKDAFPEHQILAEEFEKGDVNAEHLWIVDPLDGTNNFAHGLPHCAVSIAYYFRGNPICGIVNNPIRDDWYEATLGGGAFHNSKPVSVANHRSLSESLVGVGFYYDRGKIMEHTLNAVRDFFYRDIHGIRRFGTASLDLCMVGCGIVGAFFEFQLSPWDFAAGRLFIEEAGGQVTNCRGESLPLDIGGLVATNGLLHEQTLDIVQLHFDTAMTASRT